VLLRQGVRLCRAWLLAGFFSDIWARCVEARLRELQSCRRELRKALGEWDRLLAKTPRDKQARLLEAFAATHAKSGARRSPLGALARGKQKKEVRL
jgi:hypothetical protein